MWLSAGYGVAMMSRRLSLLAPVALTAALVVLVVPSLAACGSSSTKSGSGNVYCTKIKSLQSDKSMQNLGSSAADQKKALGAFKSVEAVAPSSIKPKWTDLRTALQAVVDAGGNAAKLKAAAPKLLNAQADTTAIRTEVKKDCKIDLNSASSASPSS